jgi:hypothetical protein
MTGNYSVLHTSGSVVIELFSCMTDYLVNFVTVCQMFLNVVVTVIHLKQCSQSQWWNYIVLLTERYEGEGFWRLTAVHFTIWLPKFKVKKLQPSEKWFFQFYLLSYCTLFTKKKYQWRCTRRSFVVSHKLSLTLEIVEIRQKMDSPVSMTP